MVGRPKNDITPAEKVLVEALLNKKYTIVEIINETGLTEYKVKGIKKDLGIRDKPGIKPKTKTRLEDKLVEENKALKAQLLEENKVLKDQLLDENKALKAQLLDLEAQIRDMDASSIATLQEIEEDDRRKGDLIDKKLKLKVLDYHQRGLSYREIRKLCDNKISLGSITYIIKELSPK